MPFTGNFEHVIDEKNRVSIPIQLRNQVDPKWTGKKFYLVPGGKSGGLWLYPEEYFCSLTQRIDNELIPDRDQLAFDRAVFPLAVLVELDAAGRVVLPAKDLQRAAVGREVTICGVRDHIEIVNRDEFERRLEETWKNFDEIQQQARAALMTRRQSGRMPDNS